MKIRLLVCEPLHIRVSLGSCGKRSLSDSYAGTTCRRCLVGAAVATSKQPPATWPDGRPLEYVDTVVKGTLRRAEALPKRGQKGV